MKCVYVCVVCSVSDDEGKESAMNEVFTDQQGVLGSVIGIRSLRTTMSYVSF